MKPDPIEKDIVKTAVRERYGSIAGDSGHIQSGSNASPRAGRHAREGNTPLILETPEGTIVS